MGDPDSFVQLRERFLSLARRRAPADIAEDLVQDALHIIHEKRGVIEAGEAVEGAPPLAWCFQVLRNVIGNHYQRERTRANADPAAVHSATLGDRPPSTPLESLEARESERRLTVVIDELGATDGNCARYLRALLQDLDPADLALREGVPGPVLHRRLYRCRKKLRVLLERRGILT